MATPTLTAIVGSTVAGQLLVQAGGLAKLSQQSDSQLRHMGYDELLPSFPVLRHLHAGFIAFCPLITALFGDCLDQDDHKTVAKALELTGRKALAAAKMDLAGPAADGSGQHLRTELEEAIDKARRKGKSGADDDRALPLPDVRMATGDQARRGGRKAKAQRLLEAPSVLEKAQAFVCMGADMEEQRAQIYSLREVRAEMEQRRRLQTKRTMLAAASTDGGGSIAAKRGREEEEYKDLLQIRL